MSDAVSIKDVMVEAGGRTILGPLDLRVAQGEYLLLAGPSGSGKSTLLRAIAGLAVPTNGTLDLFGARASNAGKLIVPPRKRGIGFVFQGGALWPHMSVAKTVTFALGCAGMPPSERPERVQELLAEVSLSGYDDRMPGTLSGGEGQRLALARALATSPRLLLLDEPLGMLDADLRDQLMEVLGTLHRTKGWTTIHVTHDPAEASELANRRVRLDAGRIAGIEARPQGDAE